MLHVQSPQVFSARVEIDLEAAIFLWYPFNGLRRATSTLGCVKATPELVRCDWWVVMRPADRQMVSIPVLSKYWVIR